MKCYSQVSSFDIAEHGTVSIEEAVELLRAFPTLPEVKAFQEQADSTRPLIGFQDDSGAFLEFAFSRGTLFGRFEQPFEKRILGFGYATHRDVEAIDVTIDFAERIVRTFFANDWDAIYDQMKSARPE